MKKKVDVDTSKLSIMVPRYLPCQENGKDCGLYLGLYLGTFLADPDRFVEKVVQKEEHLLWSQSPVHGILLRQNLHLLVTELQRRQREEPPRFEIPPTGHILTSENWVPVKDDASANLSTSMRLPDDESSGDAGVASAIAI